LSAPRLDYAVRVTGPLVGDIQRTMQGLWTRLALWQELEHSAFERVWHTLSRKSAPPPQAQGHTGVRAALLLRDNLQHRRDIERAYLRAIGNARREVLIANAYFIPGYRMRSALRHAVRRGVRVTLLLQGKYEHFMQFHASRSVYGRLLGSGVQIVEYHASHLHGKVAVIDGHWSTVGSSNLDPLSLLMAREANVVVDDAGFSGQLRTHLLQAMRSGGVVLNAQTFTRRPWHQRLADAVALGLMRLLVALTGQRYR
jgi:cardiolipin synthase